ncbi:MAG: M23 family metallopeptidase [Sterolibacterium sp.]
MLNLGSYTGPVLVVANGGQYVDEATGAAIPTPSALRAAIPGATGTLSASVTPLTEVAVKNALTTGGLTAANIQTENDAIKNQVGFDPVTTTPANAASPSSATASDVSKAYAAYLGTVSQYMQDTSKTLDTTTSDFAAAVKTGGGLAGNASIVKAGNDFGANSNNKTGVTGMPSLPTLSSSLGTSTPPPYTFTWNNSNGCLAPTDPSYKSNLSQLALRLFNLSANPANGIGCVTEPYLANDYSRYWSNLENHAGIDFQATVSTPVYALYDGTVVNETLVNDTPDITKQHSTLVIESQVNGQILHIFYLHCLTHNQIRHIGNSQSVVGPLGKGRPVASGDEVCQAGSVGAKAAHLHFEVRTPDMDNARLSALDGSHCPSSTFQNYLNQKVSGCGLSYIQANTLDPIVLVQGTTCVSPQVLQNNACVTPTPLSGNPATSETPANPPVSTVTPTAPPASTTPSESQGGSTSTQQPASASTPTCTAPQVLNNGTCVSVTPVIASLSFTSVPANSINRTLTISGSNFAAGNVVKYRWLNPVGSSAASASVSSTSQLSASFNPGAVADTIYVKVCQSSTSTTCSNELSIAVTATPVISALSFTSVPADSTSRTLTISGSNFAAGNVVKSRWLNPVGSSTASASVSSASQLSASFNPGAVTDTIYVKVCQSSTSTDCSGELSIAVTVQPATGSSPFTSGPAISSLSFTSVPADSTSRTLTIAGSNFIAGNVVKYRWFNPAGSSTASASVSSTLQLSALFNPGAVTDTVYVKVCQSSTSTTCSNELSIAVTATPAISSLSYTSVLADSTNRTLTISGSNFAAGNVVKYRWLNPVGSSTASASVSSASQLSTLFNPGAVTDTIYVKVCQSSTSTDCSSELSIAVTATPAISSLSFTSVPADSTNRTLTISGSNFAAGNVVKYRWLNPVGSSTALASVSSASQLSAPFNPGAVTDTIYVKICQSSTSMACSGELSIAVH